MYLGSKIPRCVRPFLAWILRCAGQSRTAEVVAAMGEKTIHEFYAAVVDRKKYESNYLKSWKEEKLDILITPGGALPALPLGAFRDLFPSFMYVVFEREVREFQSTHFFFMFQLRHSNQKNISRIAHLKKISRKSSRECKTDCDGNLN